MGVGTFPQVWPAGRDGGFDIVLGKFRPYVKLQNST